MPRTTVAAVRATLLDDYKPGHSLTVFISDAALMVDDLEENDEDGLLSDARLEAIERYTAAHLYACTYRPLNKKDTGKSGGTFDGETGSYMAATLYGQRALGFDITGRLSAIAGSAENKIAEAVYLGEEPEE